jgi:hypothetical protein
VTTPSIIPDDIPAWIEASQATAMAILAADVTESAARDVRATLCDLQTIRETLLMGQAFSRRQSANARARKGSTLDRDLLMLAEYEKRVRNRDLFNTGRSNTAIAADVGRLKTLSKNGTLKALARARAHKNNPSTERGKVD